MSVEENFMKEMKLVKEKSKEIIISEDKGRDRDSR